MSSSPEDLLKLRDQLEAMLELVEQINDMVDDRLEDCDDETTVLLGLGRIALGMSDVQGALCETLQDEQVKAMWRGE